MTTTRKDIPTMTTPIVIHRLSTGWWTATQKQGSAQLPVTVASSSKTPDGVLDSVKARQAAGMIPADAEVQFMIDSLEAYDELFGDLTEGEVK